jgi:hypothetical protein
MPYSKIATARFATLRALCVRLDEFPASRPAASLGEDRDMARKLALHPIGIHPQINQLEQHFVAHGRQFFN